jgi:hypothetical protein
MVGKMFNKIDMYLFKKVNFVKLEIVRILFYSILFFQFDKFIHYLNFSKMSNILFHPAGLIINEQIINFIASHSDLILIMLRVSLLFSIFGFMTSITKWIVFILILFIFNIPYNFNSDFLLATPNVFLSLVLAFSPAGQNLSIDSMIFKKNQKKYQQSENYNWPIKFMQIIFVTVFFTSALIKLKNVGLAWFYSDNIKNIFLCSPFTRGDIVPRFIMDLKLNYRITQFPLAINIFAFLILASELLCPLALYETKWTKLIVWILMFMQISSVFFIFINPNDNIVLYLCWFDWESIFSWIKEKFNLTSRISYVF